MLDEWSGEGCSRVSHRPGLVDGWAGEIDAFLAILKQLPQKGGFVATLAPSADTTERGMTPSQMDPALSQA